MSILPHSRAPIKTAHASALQRAVSFERFAVFDAIAEKDPELACRLYIWDRDVAAAILRDIAIVEVALRNALSAELTAHFSSTWFNDSFFSVDRRLKGQRDQAIDSLRQSGKGITPGRVTAQLSLGFWVNLLDARGSDLIWRKALYRAFPGGKAEARTTQSRYNRTWLLSQLRAMRFLRNRCAHHESLIHGFPLPGQAQRMSTTEGIEAYLRVLRMLDRNLADWMLHDSVASDILTHQPKARRASR